MRWDIDGGSVVIETQDDEIGGWAPASPFGLGVVHDAKVRFQDALVHVRDAASVALQTFRDIPAGPDEVEIEFGVKLGTEAGAVIAKTALEGHLTVKLKWSGQSPGDSPR
ncbi:CU044_2847 family protein [Nonomuraea sp. NPDC002799]